MTFGRKGLPPGAASVGIVPARRNPVQVPAEPVDDRVAAFLAEERSRVSAGEVGYAQPGTTYHGSSAPQVEAALGGAPVAGSAQPKSMLLAYVLWWFGYALSAHRFYLGDFNGAIKQCGLFLSSLAVLFISRAMNSDPLSLLAVIGFLAALLWMVADMFLIPGLCRNANARIAAENRIFT